MFYRIALTVNVLSEHLHPPDIRTSDLSAFNPKVLSIWPLRWCQKKPCDRSLTKDSLSPVFTRVNGGERFAIAARSRIRMSPYHT